MKINAVIRTYGVEFKLVAESEYEHAMLRFLASQKYNVKGAFTESSSWRPHDPTECSLHLSKIPEEGVQPIDS